MTFKTISVGIAAVFVFFNGIFNCSFAEQSAKADDSDQQINDFSLSGYGDKGKKAWDIGGKSADIYSDTVKFKDVTGNLYGEKEEVKLTADRGDFNKAEGKVHLEQDVVITSSSGAKLTTDSLDWDRKNDVVSTKDKVNIAKDNIISTSLGATGHPGLSKVNLDKDVKVEILPEEKKDQAGMGAEKIVITCDGPLLIDYEKNIATFSNNVKVDRQESQIYSDTMEVNFTRDSGKQKNGSPVMNSSVEKIIARGNVKIVRGENVSYSDEATYSGADRKIMLSGNPKLVIYSTEGMNASFGN
jgi:LPS export ABC transporter protein LptC